MNRFRLIAAAASLALIPAIAVAAPAEGPVREIAFVHGALADGSGWKPVAYILRRDGFTVSVVQQPETSLAEDVVATNRVLDKLTGPAVLVGHSYAGAIISEAGSNPNLERSMYRHANAKVTEITGSQSSTSPTRAPSPSSSRRRPGTVVKHRGRAFSNTHRGLAKSMFGQSFQLTMPSAASHPHARLARMTIVI